MLAGALAAPRRYGANDLDIWALGVLPDAPRGAGLFAVLGWIRWAREHGFDGVDHLASPPLHTDGLTRQKLRWGTSLVVPPECREVVALRLHGDRPPLRTWLAGHRFAACSAGGLVPVAVGDPAKLAAVARSLGFTRPAVDGAFPSRSRGG
jgi:hypothetical protein